MIKQWMIDHTMHCMAWLTTSTALFIIGVWFYGRDGLSHRTREQLSAETGQSMACTTNSSTNVVTVQGSR